jgi:hypothetical protein
MSESMRLYAPTDCGSDGYPPEWHASIKHAVREAAGNRCVRCLHPYAKGAGEWSQCDERCTHLGPYRVTYRSGATAGVDGPGTASAGMALALDPGVVEAVDAHWRILTVHHLNGDKHDCRWWNLAALCQRCHLQIQGKVQMARVWPWEHSDWFKPYVAGYYAWAYLGEELSREEVEGRLDELLALERQVA